MRRKSAYLAVLFLFPAALSPSCLLGEAFTIPVSDQVVEGELILPGDIRVQFVAREGTWVTVKDDDKGYWYGFQPIIDQKSGQPIFRPFSIRELQVGQHAVDQIGPPQIVRLNAPPTEFSNADHLITIETKEIETWDFPKVRVRDIRNLRASDLQKIYGKSGGGLCCVSCGSSTACANSVTMDCGSCDGGGGGGPRVQ